MNTSEQADRQNVFPWLIVVTVIIGTFLGRLDQTVVNLALPKIIEDFHVTVTAAGWIATAYILANAVFVPIWGKLGDTIGRKKVYVIGFVVFIIGSVLSGLAWNLSSMIVFRVIQAIAGSADYPTAMAILAVTFPEGRKRSQALGLWSVSFALASVFGPLVGGPLIDTFGWRSVFLINLPVGLLGLGMALTFIRESVGKETKHRFDWWGAITLGAALASLVLVLDQGQTWGWASLPSVLSYVATIVWGVIFLVIEQHHPEPIVDLKFFRNSAFVCSLLNSFIAFMGMMGSVFLVPIFAETFLGYTATQTGYLFIPMAVFMVMASWIGGRLTGLVQPRWVIIFSTAVAAFGLSLFAYLDPRSSAMAIMVPLAIMSFGLGFGMGQRSNVIVATVPVREVGVASSISALARNVAGAFGIALFGTILNSTINSNVMRIASNSVVRSLSPLDYQRGVELIILKAQVSAYGTVFSIASGVMLVGIIAAFWIRLPKTAGLHTVETFGEE